MDIFRFRKFPVYQDAKRFNLDIFQTSKAFPLEIKSQIIRSSSSIGFNIAEGSAKKSDKDFNRYIENALGSVSETVAILEMVYELKLITEERWQHLFAQAEIIAKQLGGLSKKLKS